MLKILKIEWMKLRGTQVWLVAALLPLLAVIQGVVLLRLILARNTGLQAGGSEAWSLLYTGSMMLFTPLMLPVLVALLTALVARVEHQQNNWKQIFALPIRRELVFAAKLLLSTGLCAFSLIMLGLGTLAAGFVSGLRAPIPWELVVARPVLVGLAALPALGVQFYLSYRFHNVIIPLVAAAGLTLPAMLASYSESLWIYYPWAYPTVIGLTDAPLPQEQLALALAISIALFAAASAFSITRFIRHDIV